MRRYPRSGCLPGLSRSPWNFGGGPSSDQAASSSVAATALTPLNGLRDAELVAFRVRHDRPLVAPLRHVGDPGRAQLDEAGHLGLQVGCGHVHVHAVLGGLALGHLGEQPRRVAVQVPPARVAVGGHADRGEAARRLGIQGPAECGRPEPGDDQRVGAVDGDGGKSDGHRARPPSSQPRPRVTEDRSHRRCPMARSDQVGRDLVTWRRSTATSCRSTRISAFLAAWPRASSWS